MFKKILIAMMAVAVFAIPMGASASASATDYSPYTGYSNSLVFKSYSNTNKISLKTSSGVKPDFFVNSSNRLNISTSDSSTIFVYQQRLIDGEWQYIDSFTLSSPVFFTSFDSLVYSSLTVYDGSVGGDVFFTAKPLPPQPVTIQAVKTVGEIVPQAGAVAGGIVLVASILLGLWLMVGLVKRLVFSFLR